MIRGERSVFRSVSVWVWVWSYVKALAMEVVVR